MQSHPSERHADEAKAAKNEKKREKETLSKGWALGPRITGGIGQRIGQDRKPDRWVGTEGEFAFKFPEFSSCWLKNQLPKKQGAAEPKCSKVFPRSSRKHGQETHSFGGEDHGFP